MERGEKWGYVLACVVLVFGGALLRTPILNWISGPAIVIGSVALTTWLSGRRSRSNPGDAAGSSGRTQNTESAT